MLTDKELSEFFDKCVLECPSWIVDKSVKELKSLFEKGDTISKITEEYNINPIKWWAPYHHGWGTAIRNFLRDKVCEDKELPTGNFDDYYIQFVEMACGLRNK